MRKQYEVEQRSDRWHELRAKSIGGSDISVLFDLNKYKTPTELWMSKRGLVEPEDISEKDDVRRGIILEDTAWNMFLENHLDLQDQGAPMFVDESNFMHHSPDGIVANDDRERCLVEIKVPRPSRVTDIINEGPDLAWIMQVQHGIHCCECDLGIIVVLDVNSMRLIEFPVSRNSDVIDKMKAASKSFFENYVIADEPPYDWKPPHKVVSGEVEIKGKDKDVETFEAPSNGIFEIYAAASIAKKEAEEDFSDSKKVVEAWFRDNTDDGTGLVVTSDGTKIRRSMVKGRESFDAKTLIHEHPEIDKKRYTKPPTPYPMIRVTKPRGKK